MKLLFVPVIPKEFTNNNRRSSNAVAVLPANNNKQQQLQTQSSSSTTQYRNPLLKTLNLKGRIIANALELTLSTSSSYLSSFVLGYALTCMTSIPTIIKPSAPGLSWGIHQKSVINGRSWASLGACFSGFTTLSKLCRGGKEDKWNNINSSFFTGAILNRGNGWKSVLWGGVSYAGFSWGVDEFFGGGKKK